MKILIPPSEGKSKVKPLDITFEDTDFQYKEYVEQIVTLLSLLDDEDLSSIYGTSQEKAELFHRQNQDIFHSRCAKAIDRYTGVVYEYLDWNSLDNKAHKYLNEHVCIFSGLFGIISPDTLIPNYKLKMNVLSLQNHWSPIITDHLKNEDIIFDLLPQVHRKAYKPQKNVIQVDFSVINKGKKTAAGHFGKAVKGKFIRFLAENQIHDIKEFSKFEYDGFVWDKDHFIKEIK